MDKNTRTFSNVFLYLLENIQFFIDKHGTMTTKGFINVIKDFWYDDERFSEWVKFHQPEAKKIEVPQRLLEPVEVYTLFNTNGSTTNSDENKALFYDLDHYERVIYVRETLRLNGELKGCEQKECDLESWFNAHVLSVDEKSIFTD